MHKWKANMSEKSIANISITLCVFTWVVETRSFNVRRGIVIRNEHISYWMSHKQYTRKKCICSMYQQTVCYQSKSIESSIDEKVDSMCHQCIECDCWSDQCSQVHTHLMQQLFFYSRSLSLSLLYRFTSW